MIVLDAVGAGALPDAADYGDEGSDTLGNVARPSAGSTCPNLEALGLGNVEPLEGCPPQPGAPAVAGRLLERSKGKDTTTGHWELMGVVTPTALPTYPHGFPHDVIDPFMHRTGRGVLGNKPASGTEIIQELGEEHQRTGKWIVYTSADSVFQIAAHEETIPLEELYEALPDRARDPDRQARGRARDRAAVHRRARATTSGRRTGTTSRSSRRRPNYLTLRARGRQEGARRREDRRHLRRLRHRRVAPDEVERRGDPADRDAPARARRRAWCSSTSSRPTCSGATATTRSTSTAACRTSTAGCRTCSTRCGHGDLLILTSDHGCDPTTPSTDHSREHALLLAYVAGAQRGRPDPRGRVRRRRRDRQRVARREVAGPVASRASRSSSREARTTPSSSGGSTRPRLGWRRAARRRRGTAQGPDGFDTAFAAVGEAHPRRVLEVGCGMGRVRRADGSRDVGRGGCDRPLAADGRARARRAGSTRGVARRPGASLRGRRVRLRRGQLRCSTTWPTSSGRWPSSRRVLEPGGRLVATTIGVDHMLELWELVGYHVPERHVLARDGRGGLVPSLRARRAARRGRGASCFPTRRRCTRTSTSTLVRGRGPRPLPDFDGLVRLPDARDGLRGEKR